MGDKVKRNFNFIAIFCIIIFACALTPIALQNDTFYSIKLGEHIAQNGIDMMDHFSWNDGLPYTYPHWLFDTMIYLIYSIGKFDAIYILTMIFASILGISLYVTNCKVTKNKVTSFIITMISLYLIKDYICARAQLVTFILFELEFLCIEMMLEKKSKKYGIGLIVISILIANLHVAVWPFFFVIFLPYIEEYILSSELDFTYELKKRKLKKQIKKLSDKNANIEKIEELQKELETEKIKSTSMIERMRQAREKSYKIKLEHNNIIKWVIVFAIICVFTGLFTPLGKVPYTYLYDTIRGNTMQNISEHLPMRIIDNLQALVSVSVILIILIFTNIKIKVRDLFMVVGLTILMLMTRRQFSIFVLICNVIVNRWICDLINKSDEDLQNKMLEVIMKRMAWQNSNSFINYINKYISL